MEWKRSHDDSRETHFAYLVKYSYEGNRRNVKTNGDIFRTGTQLATHISRYSCGRVKPISRTHRFFLVDSNFSANEVLAKGGPFPPVSRNFAITRALEARQADKKGKRGKRQREWEDVQLRPKDHTFEAD